MVTVGDERGVVVAGVDVKVSEAQPSVAQPTTMHSLTGEFKSVHNITIHKYEEATYFS